MWIAPNNYKAIVTGLRGASDHPALPMARLAAALAAAMVLAGMALAAEQQKVPGQGCLGKLLSSACLQRACFLVQAHS